MNEQITSIEEAKRLIGERQYRVFTFPILGITFKYRRPDMLKLSLSGSLPTAMAEIIIDAYKTQMNGGSVEDFTESHKSLKNIDDDLLKELRGKGYGLLRDLVTSHKVLDVPESDLDTGVISWQDIPEEDAMAFMLHLINAAQMSATADGGEVSVAEVTNFPDKKQVSKRNTSGKNRQGLRQVASS
jgi:hypothetical protein